MDHRIMIVAGTRPELIKLAPVFWELERKGINYVFVWSGQHYDYEMSHVFMEELKIPNPDFDLGVGSGSHAVQTAKAMIGVEEAIRYYRPNLIVALGDTNTVVATALSSVKSLVPFAHIEAGVRSWNMAMPEEVNRKIADHVAQLLFTHSELATVNVLAEGVSGNVIQTGNTIIDALKKAMLSVERYGARIVEEIGESIDNPFILATVHRQENTDNMQRLASIVKALVKLAAKYIVIVPIHPRTHRRLAEYGLMKKLKAYRNIKLLKPLGYFEFLYLLKRTQVVLTDSGGVQGEAFTLKIPTVTIRYSTEYPETVLLGCNVLAGADTDRIVEYTLHMIRVRKTLKSRLARIPNPYGDGKAGEKIINAILEYLGNPNNQIVQEPDLRNFPLIVYMIKKLSSIKPTRDEVLCYINEDGKLTSNIAKAVAAYVRSKVRLLKPWENLEYL